MRGSLGAALLLAFTPYARAVNAPTSAAAVVAIQAKIDRANQMYLGTPGATPGQLVGGIQQLELSIAAEESSIDPNRAKIATDKVRLAQMREGERALRQEILEDTKKLYGIRPDGMSRPLTGFRFKGMRATWKPQFAEWSAEHVATRGDEQIILTTKSRYVAATWENGDIVITRAAFLSPAYLAAVIYHETIHFNQFTDPFRNPGTLSRRDRELKAHWAMSSVKFGLTKNEQALIDDASQRAQNAPEADAASEFLEPSVGSDLSANLEAIRETARGIGHGVDKERRVRHLMHLKAIAEDHCKKKDYNQDTFDSMWYAEDKQFYLDEQNEFSKNRGRVSTCEDDTYAALLSHLSHYDRLHTWMFPKAAPPPPEPPTAPRVPDPPNVWAPKPRVPATGESDLADLVEKACKDPGGFQRSGLDFSWFPVPGYSFSFGPRNPADHCQRALWDDLMALNARGGRLDLDDVAQRAWGYQPRTPPPRNAAPDCPRRQGGKCVPELGD